MNIEHWTLNIENSRTFLAQFDLVPLWFLADLYLVRIWLGLSNKLSSLVFGQFVCLSVQSAGFVCFPIYRSSLLCLAAPTSPPLPGIIFQPYIFSELLENMIPPSIACHKIILMKNRVGSKALQIPNKTNKRTPVLIGQGDNQNLWLILFQDL